MHLLKIYCIKADFPEDYDCHFVVDLDKRRLYLAEELEEEGKVLQSAIEIYLEPISDFMSFIFEVDDIDFLDDEDFKKSLLKYVLEEFETKTVVQLFEKMDNTFEEKETAELFALFDLNYYECNHHLDPIEYNLTAKYVGMLFKDLKVEKK